MITTALTNDGRITDIQMLRSIFNGICDAIVVRDNEWIWKEVICWDTEFKSVCQANLICTAIEFFVGGKTTCFMYVENGIQRIEFTNRGYYVNIGV